MRAGLADVSPCSIGLQLYAVLNNTGDEDYFVELISDECCLNSDEETDCDSVEIIGESSEVIQKGNARTFTLVAPVLDPYERNGYCVIHVDSRPVDKRSNIMRDTITIDFDTILKNIANNLTSVKKCKNKDEDPFNDCNPVDCDIYYNGKKPIYDKYHKKCIGVPKCRSKKSEASNVYDPTTNRCTIVDSIEKEDIEFIKSLCRDRQPKDVIIVEAPDVTVKAPVDPKTFIKAGFHPKIDEINIKRKLICNSVVHYLITNKYTILILALVVFVQCCLICTMIYCLTKKTIFCDKKKVERKYYNYRQDVSVTTPLIATSNNDTDTAFDYISESSNIEKKIKCYKSCQKDKKNDAKTSLSDDILTKCLNRRNWNTKPRSDITKNANNSYFNSFNAEWKALQSNIKETTVIETQANNKEEKETGTDTMPDNQNITYNVRQFKEDYTDSDSSEKIIECHDYNFAQAIKIGTGKCDKKAPSISTEKGAQACFSNDSIDDFLSERGITFLAGDRLSKYSFASDSTSNRTENSSKTSKNRNIVKSVLSYLSKKSKKYTSSDPGCKNDEGKDLELIHMSKASMYSSSASDYKNIQGIKLTKDSRSTF